MDYHSHQIQLQIKVIWLWSLVHPKVACNDHERNNPMQCLLQPIQVTCETCDVDFIEFPLGWNFWTLPIFWQGPQLPLWAQELFCQNGYWRLWKSQLWLVCYCHGTYKQVLHMGICCHLSPLICWSKKTSHSHATQAWAGWISFLQWSSFMIRSSRSSLKPELRSPCNLSQAELHENNRKRHVAPFVQYPRRTALTVA